LEKRPVEGNDTQIWALNRREQAQGISHAGVVGQDQNWARIREVLFSKYAHIPHVSREGTPRTFCQIVGTDQAVEGDHLAGKLQCSPVEDTPQGTGQPGAGLPAEGIDQVVEIDFSQGKDLFCQRLLPLIVCKSIARGILFPYRVYAKNAFRFEGVWKSSGVGIYFVSPKIGCFNAFFIEMATTRESPSHEG
jgi:hypothetical protein